MRSNLICDQLADLINAAAGWHSEDLSLPADDENIRLEAVHQHIADVIEDNLRLIVVVKQFVDFSCFVKQLYAHYNLLSYDEKFPYQYRQHI